MTPFPRRGLYAITDPSLTSRDAMVAAAAGAIEGGAVAIQYRDKSTDPLRRKEDAIALLALCRSQAIPLIVNDDIALAQSVGADGVHLGKHDTSISAARRVLGSDVIIGVSCYDEADRAYRAERADADYVAFGSFFPSITKPNAVRAEPALLREVRPRLHVPIVAIGGITPANGGALLRAGADLLAVISGVLGADNVVAATLSYTELFR